MHSKDVYVQSQKTLVMIFGLICLLLLLAACGTNSSATTITGSGNSTTPGATSPTTVASAATQDCGTVHTMRLLIVPADEDQAQVVEDCFWQAYQQCHPAKMVYSQVSLDSGTIHNFSLKSANGTCVITDGQQHFVAPRPPKDTTNYTCAGLKRSADGLDFMNCGPAGDIVVPAGSTS